MEGNPMMPNGMHPNMHSNMHVDGQQIPPELHQLHQRQMQLLFENGGFNQAAMQQGQNPTPMQIRKQKITKLKKYLKQSLTNFFSHQV